MISIYKYELAKVDEQRVALPHTAKILCVQVQRGIPCAWAEVDTAFQVSERIFYTYGTGHPIPEDRMQTYVGTYQLEGGALVFHVYVN